jgi:MYXO-CTERM domain-containing protein
VRVSLFGAAAGALVLLSARPAIANGRFPASNQLLFSPQDPNLVVMRATYGVLISHDAGATWTWLCEDALGIAPSASEDPALGLTANGSLVAGIYSGLEVSPDTGCTWTFAGGGLANQSVVDVDVPSSSPDTVLAMTSTYEADAGADGGPGNFSRVYQSTDDGAHWSPFGPRIDPTVSMTTLDVAPNTNPIRLYAVGFSLVTPGTPLFFVGGVGGWTEQPMAPLSREVSMFIAGVDPATANLVYLRSEGAPTNGQSRLYVTSDGGRTFRTLLSLNGQMLGFALSPDGSKIYAGSAQDGLFVAARANIASANPFQKVSSIHVQCLATHGAELWACSDEPSGFIAGVSTNDGATFTAKLHLDGIRSPIACPQCTTAAQCSGAPFQLLCQMVPQQGCAGLDGGGPVDAGGPCDDAGAATDASAVSDGGVAVDSGAQAGGDASTSDGGLADAGPVRYVPASSCGCSVVGGRGAAGISAFAVLAALGARTKRRRRV